MLTKINRSEFQPKRIVVKAAEANVTFVTKERPDNPGYVIVVHVKSTTRPAGGPATYGATASLCGYHVVIILDGDAVVLNEITLPTIVPNTFIKAVPVPPLR